MEKNLKKEKENPTETQSSHLLHLLLRLQDDKPLEKEQACVRTEPRSHCCIKKTYVTTAWSAFFFFNKQLYERSCVKVKMI